MNDHDDIRRLMADYCFGTDTGDIERWTDCFASDAVWDGGPFGRFEGTEAARAYHQAAGDASKNFRHINTNAVIDLDGEQATVQSYIQVYDQSGPAPAIVFSGFYIDLMVKQADRWRIRIRRIVSDVADVSPVRKAKAA